MTKGDLKSRGNFVRDMAVIILSVLIAIDLVKSETLIRILT